MQKTVTANRPTIHSDTVLAAVAREILGTLPSKGGYSEDHALSHLERLFAERHFEDGYQLARRLEQNYGWVGMNMAAAEALNDAYSMLLSEVRRQTQKWVISNAIQPKKHFGDHVDFQYHGERIQGRIAGIQLASAQYIISIPSMGHVFPTDETPSVSEGLVVNYEDLHDLAESPEEFELRPLVVIEDAGMHR